MLPINEFNKPEVVSRVVDACRHIHAERGDLEDVMSFLRQYTGSKLPSIKIVSHLLDISIGEAKELVDKSRTWLDQQEEDDKLRKMIQDAFDTLSQEEPDAS